MMTLNVGLRFPHILGGLIGLSGVPSESLLDYMES